MSFKMECPHCLRALNVTEKAFGKVVPCPGCHQPVQVLHPEKQPVPAGRATPPPWASDPVPNGHFEATVTAPPSASPDDNGFDFTSTTGTGTSLKHARSHTAGGLNLANMLLGKEKEHVFQLLPDEQRLDEVTLHHKHLFVVEQGITRITLTTHRFLGTKTRVFSPAYWLLLILFPPLIFYYVWRISQNRHVSVPLGKVDSVEKSYRPDRVLFILAIFGASLVAMLGMLVLSQLSGVLMALFLVALGCVIPPALLALLLATRTVGIEVRSGADRFTVPLGGAAEAKVDGFVQRLYAEVRRAQTSSAA